MDDNSSFEESFNCYSNAVSRLQDSDDEDLACLKAEVNCVNTEAAKTEEVPAEFTLAVGARQQRRRQQRECASPMNTRGRRGRRGRRQWRMQRTASWQSSGSFDCSDNEMLNIVEINDDSPLPPVSDYSDFNAEEGEILWDSGKTTDVLNAGLSDPDLPLPCVDVEDDLEVAIHVKWRMKANNTFHLKKKDPMKQIFKHFAETEGVPENQISLTHNGKPISPHDTPEKLKSSVVILEGSLKAVNNLTEQPPEEADPNQIELKVLRKDKKDKLSIFILKSESLEVFMEKTAKQMDLPLSQLLFKFDGETVDSTETPESLDLEGGECIEVIVRS